MAKERKRENKTGQEKQSNTADKISNKGCILIQLMGFTHHDIIQKHTISLWAMKSVIVSANTMDSKAII